MSSTCAALVPGYAYDQLGRLTSWTKGSTTTEYGWDAASNRTKAGTKLASSDERNRLLNDGPGPR